MLVGECIEWDGYRSKYGYGLTGTKRSRVHRLAWEKEYGPIPEGMVVRHACDNPSCYNVDHLVLGTQADNVRDMVERGRHGNGRKTRCPAGHPYTEENTRIESGNRRRCRECDRLRQARRRAS